MRATKEIKHNYPFVSVIWCDHWASTVNEPHSLEDIAKMAKEFSTRETGGFLVHENRRVVVLAGTIEEDGKLTECNFLFKKLILKRSDKSK